MSATNVQLQTLLIKKVMDILNRNLKLDVADYINLRKNKCASNVCFNHIKHLNLPNDKTFWQTLIELNSDYDERFEPCSTTLDLFESKYILN